MMITLEMLEEVMERAGVDYEKAKEALQAHEGSVEAAINSLKEKEEERVRFDKALHDTFDYVKGLAEEGLLSRFVITNKGETVLNIPLGVGVLGLLFAGFFSLAGLAAAIVADYQIKVVTKDGKDIDLNAYMEKAKEKVASAVREHSQEEYVIFSEEDEKDTDTE